MISTNLRGVVNQVVRRAQRQGYVVPREVREELQQAGAPDTFWKDVVSLARPSLDYRKGRYYYVAPVSARLRQEQDRQKTIQRTVRRLIRLHRAAAEQLERRGQDRVDFIQPVKVFTEDGREFDLVSRDISPAGIRLIGTRRLLGQKVRIEVPSPEGGRPWAFLVRVLWTCAVGNDLFENGGTFLEVVADQG